ncbi:phage terminase large subunit family protein [Paraburkholderia youngii]|uniref:phage terminase large subunit family protein n=1 Tax=Paraburkholderia youngii TaxID=2782701 RepID=UPI0020CBFE0F|nr:terminase gpA endonuclease subunit [Paraburkholderia youngii]
MSSGRHEAAESLEILLPPKRAKVSESAIANLRISTPGGYEGPWDPSITPYVVEPMDCLNRRDLEATIFAGVAQSGKTQALVEGWFVYTVIDSPADMMIVHVTQDDMRTFSRDRIDRMIVASPDMNARLSPFGNDDNVFDKRFRAGNRLRLGWPAPGKFRGKNVPRMALTDYDGYPPDVGGEGGAFTLARKRTTSFMSGGMTLVESSPGFEIFDPEWKPKTEHEAPPTEGTLALYNDGDRRRWYWKCPHCSERFEAFSWPEHPRSVLHWDTSIEDPERAGATARVVCPECGCVIDESQKHGLNLGGVWLAEGWRTGEPRKSRIASFWMFGVAAAFQSWASLVANYLRAKYDEERTGNAKTLKATLNVDWGVPYVPPQTTVAADPDEFQARAEKGVEKRRIWGDVRFLTTAIDQQKNRFVVQVIGWGPDGERWVVDRFNVTESDRLGEDGKPLRIQPFSHAEDWSALDKVIERVYRTESGATLEAKMVLIDSGGADDASENAYAYWRRLHKMGNSTRVRLIKGGSTPKTPRCARSKTESERLGVPLWILNVDQLKDEIDRSLTREAPGPGYIHFPDWLGSWFYKELTAEVRTPQGWKRRSKSQGNEALDLMVYNLAAFIMLGGEFINWAEPPHWARPLAQQVSDKEDDFSVFAKIGRSLNS